VTVLAINLVGDRMRDALDPRMCSSSIEPVEPDIPMGAIPTAGDGITSY
jgi:hypothetical protein